MTDEYNYVISSCLVPRFGRLRVRYIAVFYCGPMVVGEGGIYSFNRERLKRKALRRLARLNKERGAV